MCFLFSGCKHRKTNDGAKTDNTETTESNVVIPKFDADSAYSFVAAQTAFGPRVPGSKAHEDCAAWLVKKLSLYADTVMVQNFRTRLYDGKNMDGKNIIASFNPDAAQRIVLCSHWDSRPFADHDANQANWNTPIDGANDGASGVGVLIEMARVIRTTPLKESIGLDLVLFDLEDYGPPQSVAENFYNEEENDWALGAQYWSKQPHIAGYKAKYGILLDMVGGKDPNFMKEYYSQSYANGLSNKAWRMAFSLGYGDCFSNELGNPIDDDHIPMNEIAKIPTIDIIDLQPQSVNGTFPDTWHTLNDNLSNIDKGTLGKVGTVVLNLLYHE